MLQLALPMEVFMLDRVLEASVMPMPIQASGLILMLSATLSWF
jgi:hypothetical protein